MISVIIPVREGAATLTAQFEAFAQQRYAGDWEVIVADGGSTDETRELVLAWSDRLPGLRRVDASERRGKAWARNVGAREAKGEVLAFCDPENTVTPGWLQAMDESLRVYDLAGGRLERWALNDAARSGRGHADRLSVGLAFLPYAPGSNLGIRAEVLQQLGGWDNETSAHGSEATEISWRAQLAGYRVGFASDAVVLYRHRHTVPGLARQFYRWGCGHPLLYRKFRDRGLRRESFAQVIRAWAWFLIHLPDLFASPERRDVWWRKVGTRTGRIRGSIRYRVLFL